MRICRYKGRSSFVIQIGRRTVCKLAFKGTPSSPSVRRLGIWVAALSLPIVVLVPTIFDLTFVYLNPQAAFYPVKFGLLMRLSVPLLVALLGFVLLQRKRLGVPLLVPALGFLGISTLSALLSREAWHSLVGDRYDGLLTLGAGVLLFYATARCLDSWARVRVLLVAVATTATIVSVYGVAQKYRLDPVLGWEIPWYDGSLRAFSTLGNPLQLTSYLTLAAGATIALYFLTEARWERALWMIVLALIGACWLYAQARGAMLGVVVALPILLWLSYRRMGTVRPLLVPLGVLVAAMMVATMEVSAFTTPDSPTAERPSEEKSLSVLIRLQIWRDTVPVILERPLLGHGPDNFAEPFERYEGNDLEKALFNPATGKPDTVDKAHNELLQVAATTGILGLAAYLSIFVSYFRNAYRSGGWPLLALSGGVLAYILQLQTAFTTIATGVTFWAVLGVSVAVMRLQEQENAKEDLKSPAPEGIEATPDAGA
jgi:O-antigen ligase